MPEINLFRMGLFSVLLLLFSYFFLSQPSNKQKRAPIQASFTFVASEWPSLTPSSTQTGYCTTPQPWSQKSFQSVVLNFQFKADASWNIAVNQESDLLVKCPTGNFGSAGSCWWSCGGADTQRPGITGWNCHRPSDVTQCTQPKSWALTFDDGPQPSSLNLLKLLQQNNLKGTFFMVGANMVQYPDIVRQLYNAGMELGVHTWSHHPLTTLPTDVIIAELMWTMKAFYDILGVVPKYFRPPMGDIDDRVRSIVNQLGLITVIWDLDVQDYTTDGHAELIPTVKNNFLQNSIISSLAATFPSGIITLEHDYFQGGVDLFSQLVLPQVKQSGFAVLDLDDCIGIQNWLLIDTTPKVPVVTPAPPTVQPGKVPPAGASQPSASQPSTSTKKSGALGTVPTLLWFMMSLFCIYFII